MEKVRQIYYRGSLKSCNYSCKYCPFSKGKWSEHGWKQDRNQLLQFVEKVGKSRFHGAVQIVPYGEALIHEYYWEGLARLSTCKNIQAVGSQSNFSFPFEKMYDVFVRSGGRREKLRLWGTFHPEMVSVEAFLTQCRKLQEAGILFCVGAVGAPENLRMIQELREKLDRSVYLWVNRMDGLGRPYTDEEVRAFTEIDEYFEQELKHIRSDAKQCGSAIFVNGDGKIFPCNLCRREMGNLYNDNFDALVQGGEENERRCSRKECSCYISYCNRPDIEELLFFQPYPAFRIPFYKKAVFFDVDGTLVREGEREISDEVAQKLLRLARHSDIFLATSLPYETAMKKVGKAADVLCGGVFANGARIRVKGEHTVIPLENALVERMKKQGETYDARIKVYKTGDIAYKITMSFRNRKNLQKMLAEVKEADCHMAEEEGRLQITAAGTGKLEGVRMVCEKIGVSFDEIAVFGNDENDLPMLQEVPFSVAAPGSSEAVRKLKHIKVVF